MSASAAMKMPLLDRAFYLLDSFRSPQDFTLILDLDGLPEIDRFYAGARSAMNRFPASASSVEGRCWVWRENKYFRLELLNSSSESEVTSAIERFIDQRFDLRHQPPVKQLLILNGPGTSRLATRFHHAAADGLSAALWLGHQLNVAYGVEGAQIERDPFVELGLRSQTTSVRRSQFAFEGSSDCLWTTNSRRSGVRRWSTIGFPAVELQKGCRRAGGFTYSDLLATCTLEVLSQWNASHHESRAETRNNCRGGTPWPPLRTKSETGAATEGRPYKIGLWIPINVRRKSAEGFGNGTSRIRVYARHRPGASLVEKCRAVREQVSWTSDNGEWVVPEIPWLTSLPRPIIQPLLRSYLTLPSVDMATAVFSHAGSWMTNGCEAFKHVKRIDCIGLLHPRQRLAINAATHCGQTWLSFTYDPALLTTEDVKELTRIYEQQIAAARGELL